MPGLVSETFTFDGLPVYLPEVLESQCLAAGEPIDWAGKANSFRVVRGREPSRGWLLMTGLQLDAIDLNSANHYLEIKEAGELPSSAKWEKLVVVRADAILPGPEPTTETMYLVEIADRRVYGKLTRARGSVQDNHGYNLRTIPCFGQEVTEENDYVIRSRRNAASPPGVWTWVQMFSDLWSGFNLSTMFGAWSDVDIDDAVWPASDPENIPSGETIGWDLFCHILDHIGHAVVPKQNGKWKIVRIGTEQEGLVDQLELLKSTGRLLGVKHSRVNSKQLMPQYVVVNFPYSSRITYDGSGTYPAVSTHAWIDWPNFRELVTTSTVLGTDNPVATTDQTFAVVYDSMTALHDRTQTMTASVIGDKATNQVALTARAKEIAEAWLRKNYNQFHPNFTHNSYIGNVPNIPSSQISGLCFYDTGNGLRTDFVFHPYSMDMESNKVRAAEYDAVRLNPLDSPGPPDIGRPHPPTDLLCPVVIGTAGTGLPARSSELHDTMTGSGPELAASVWNGSSEQIEGFTGVSQLNALHDALGLHHVSSQSAIGMFFQDVNKWVAIAGNQIHEGEVSQGWRDAPSDSGWIITVEPYHADDQVSKDDPITVWIPPNNCGHPNVVVGDTVVFARTSTNDPASPTRYYVCLSEVMDDAVGTVKQMTNPAGSAPDGWAIMNGTSNAAGSGIDMTGKVASYGFSSPYDPGDSSSYVLDTPGNEYNPATLPIQNLLWIERLNNSDP